MKLAKCPGCGGYARVADQRCTYPGCDAGYVPACFNCESEAVDPLQAPFCSGACREAWEAKDGRSGRGGGGGAPGFSTSPALRSTGPLMRPRDQR